MRAGALHALWAFLAMGCGDELMVLSETRKLMSDDQSIPLETSCESLSSAHGTTTSTFNAHGPVDAGLVNDILEVQRQFVGEELQVIVRNGGRTLAAKGYGRRFLESGKLDRFTVTTFTGARYEFLYRGGPDCVPLGRFDDG